MFLRTGWTLRRGSRFLFFLLILLPAFLLGAFLAFLDQLVEFDLLLSIQHRSHSQRLLVLDLFDFGAMPLMDFFHATARFVQ